MKTSKKFNVVMMCASGKNQSYFTDFPEITFVSTPLLDNEKNPDDLIDNTEMTWRDYLFVSQNDNTLLMAYELYIPNIYIQLHNHFGNKLFILSAGWGLVSSEFKVPNYDITFSQTAPANTIRNINNNVPPLYNDYNQIDDSDSDIIFVGTPNYIPLFISLTQNLNCRKIVYYKNNDALQYEHLNNGTFEFRYYNTPARQKWYYQLAHDLCNDILP